MSGNKNILHILLIFLEFFQTTLLISANSSPLLYEIEGFIRVYKNGTVERLVGTGFVPASIDPKTGVWSKDVNVAPNVSARLYMPENANPRHKVPLLVYYHGGAFCTGSASAPEYHNYLNSLVAEANIVAVSVNYRLSPENPLPIGYEDAWMAIRWVFSEAWIKKYVDFQHVYLGGDSAGGNIAHNMAMRAGLEFDEPDGVAIEGVFLDCPHFWGKKPIGSEMADVEGKALMESIWIHAYPNSTGFDDPLVNPAMDPNLAKLGAKRVLVFVAEKDVLRDRGWYYAETLRNKKWNGVVEVFEYKEEKHIFNIVSPNKANSVLMMKQLAYFLNPHRAIQYS